jgi:ferredoxin
MPSAIIIGSGPAAAAVALALEKEPDWRITVLDLGLELEPGHRVVVERLASKSRDHWAQEDLLIVSAQPAAAAKGEFPEKRTHGSDYPFRDVGQLSPMAVERGLADALISPAYGGFSSVWGAQVLPFPEQAFESWPISRAELTSHYRSVLSAIPFSAAVDDLAEELPLHGIPRSPLPLSPRAADVACRYSRHRRTLKRMGLVLGQSRLAVRSDDCITCGLCMTGCPYSLIYSAADTFDELRSRGRIDYHGGVVAVDISETASHAKVLAREIGTGREVSFDADRLFVGCGAIGTTRLVLESLRRYAQDVVLQESALFTLPFLSIRSSGDPQVQSTHALGQLSALVTLPRSDVSPLHLQMYTYNPAFLDALPEMLRSEFARPLRTSSLSRLSVALGYLPSVMSPRLRVRLNAPTATYQRAPLVVTRDATSPDPRPILRALAGRLLSFAPRLDLWPILPRLQLSAPGKSYHWGGSFPHAASGASDFTTDRIGRLATWRRIHLVDAAVMPNLASTSFTLTMMANAHRIATESLSLESPA